MILNCCQASILHPLSWLLYFLLVKLIYHSSFCPSNWITFVSFISKIYNDYPSLSSFVPFQLLIDDFLIDWLQLDNDDSYVFLLYGGGALVTLWLASAIIGAIDSIPLVCYPSRFYVCLLIYNCKYCPFAGILMMLIIWHQFPKLMEVVGLGYTIWFSSRYLIFKVPLVCLL